MLKWYQEPLIHFLILGISLFFVIESSTSPMHNNSKNITIAKDEIDNMITFWEKRYHTAPTQEEMDILLKKYIENEMLYKEALSMGLDRDDEAIKQLLIDKLKFIVSNPANITDKALQTFYHQNKRLFLNHKEVRLSFGHIYFNPKKNHTLQTIEHRANKLYQQIQNLDFNRTFADYGDSFYKGSYFPNKTPKELASIFSHSFVQSLLKLPQKRWSKPLKSGYGIHLVYIENHTQKRLPFKKIKEAVKHKYIIEQSKKNYEKFYKTLQEKYQVHIAPYSLNKEK